VLITWHPYQFLGTFDYSPGYIWSMNKQWKSSDVTPPLSAHSPLSFRGFVLVLAALMAINALAVDIMLPGFANIAASLNTDITTVQTTITAYMMGFGLSQLFLGFLADRFGRKPVLLAGLALYAVAAILSAGAGDLSTLLWARVVQGFGAGAPRVIVGAAARDCYEGRRLARVMSLVMTIFMAAPILAPALGQAIMLVAGWRAIFAVLFLYSILLLVYSWGRFPETLAPENRRMVRWPVVAQALVSIFGNRQTVGYTLAAGAFFGSLFGFIASAQQVMVGVYGLGLWFPVAFAAMALTLSFASFANSLLVERYGMRLLSHGAVIGFSVLSGLMYLLSLYGVLYLPVFMAIHSVNMLLVGLVFANFNALAMEPQGHVAGVASAFVSAVTVVIGATIGYFIGRAFDGTVIPMAEGFFLSGLATVALLLFTERGRLFRGHPIAR
jgi:MFS transporter, DHA1 family, multidrug resistance protein